jgi:hypothetical protein
VGALRSLASGRCATRCALTASDTGTQATSWAAGQQIGSFIKMIKFNTVASQRPKRS